MRFCETLQKSREFSKKPVQKEWPEWRPAEMGKGRMVKAILSDVNIQGHVAFLVALMSAEPWKEFWEEVRIPVLRFSDVGMAADTPDSAVWHRCQAEGFVLITSNRNARGPDSLQETIRLHNTSNCLPVLTVGNAQQVFHSRAYADKIIEKILDYVDRTDLLLGTGRLFLP